MFDKAPIEAQLRLVQGNKTGSTTWFNTCIVEEYHLSAI